MFSVLLCRNALSSRWSYQLLLFGALALVSATFASAAEAAPPTPLGDAVQLAPFVVNGKRLSVAIHARTPADRRYGEKFASEVVEIADAALEGKSLGRGLVIVGGEHEPHPIEVFRKFIAMASAGQLHPAVAARVSEPTEMLSQLRAHLHLDEEDPRETGFKLKFEMIVPALPLPLEGVASRLYQLSWAENFDAAKIEQKFSSLTPEDLAADTLSKYDWVFYLPPRRAFAQVQKTVVKAAVQHEKMGLLKRAALKSALVVFKGTIKSAVEAMRKGMLFMTVLRAQSGLGHDDITALTNAYVNVLMPDFKMNGGSEHRRALEAIEKQKVRNAEYAKDPFVTPARLTTFIAEDYEAFSGNYGQEGKEKKPSRVFERTADGFTWRTRSGKPQLLYPAGVRLLVSADGKMTVEFKVDESGLVTSAEERRHRHRETFPRSPAPEPAPAKDREPNAKQ